MTIINPNTNEEMSSTLWIFDNIRDQSEIILYDEKKEIKVIITKIGIPHDFDNMSQLECEYTVHVQEGINRVVSDEEILEIVGAYCNEAIERLFTAAIESHLEKQKGEKNE